MRPAHDAAPRVVAALLRQAPFSAAKLELAWRAAVGPALARVTTVRVGGPGAIVVRAPTAAWAAEVRRAAPVIRARLAELLGEGVVAHLEVEG